MTTLELALSLQQNEQIAFLRNIFEIYMTQELMPLLTSMSDQQRTRLITFLLCNDTSQREALMIQANHDIKNIIQHIHILATKTALFDVHVKEIISKQDDNADDILTKL